MTTWRRWRFSSFLLAAGLFLGIAVIHASQETGTTPPSKLDRRVAITVDDLPGAIPGSDKVFGLLSDLERCNIQIPRILHAHNVPAIGFVNEIKLQVAGERDARAALLQKWIDAGLELGNHTYSHPNFSETPLEQFEDETVRGEVVTRALLAASGKSERFFRHPYLNTGATPEAKTAFEAFLKERGYRVAPVTVENADYAFNDVFADALAHHDEKLAEKTKAEYLNYSEVSFSYFENASRKLFGREIPQVLLIHDNEINSQALDTLLLDLQHRGYRFISLDEAMSDPAYSTPDRFVGSAGISWIERWKLAFGQKPDYENNPDPPDWVTKKFQQIRKANAN
jgi:peptidoglycan/xylan/chitin deacetylase (PgdA/CDA1 family)